MKKCIIGTAVAAVLFAAYYLACEKAERDRRLYRNTRAERGGSEEDRYAG